MWGCADGGISSDGFFRKDPSSKKQFYIPYYNAETIVYDEAARKISKIITIDKTKPYNAAIPMEQGYGLSGKAKIINSFLLLEYIPEIHWIRSTERKVIPARIFWRKPFIFREIFESYSSGQNQRRILCFPNWFTCRVPGSNLTHIIFNTLGVNQAGKHELFRRFCPIE